jgi:hypothetical protein
MLIGMVEAPMFIWALFIIIGVIGSIVTLASILYIYVKELRSGDLW